MRASFFFDTSQNQIIMTPRVYRKIKRHLCDFVVIFDGEYVFVTTRCAVRVISYSPHLDTYVQGILSEASKQCDFCIHRLKPLTGSCREHFSSLHPSMSVAEFAAFLHKKNFKESRFILDDYYASFDIEQGMTPLSLVFLFLLLPFVFLFSFIPSPKKNKP